MRKSIQILITLVLITSLFSCKSDVKKEGAPSSNNVSSNYYITAKIDGKDISGAQRNIFAVATKVQGVTFYNISGEDKGNDAYFTFYYKSKVDLDPTIKAESYGVSYPADKTFMAIKDKEGFKFEVTNETDSYIEGVFSFTAREIAGIATINVSDGKFKAKKI